jgi:hypothetical protein
MPPNLLLAGLGGFPCYIENRQIKHVLEVVKYECWPAAERPRPQQSEKRQRHARRQVEPRFRAAQRGGETAKREKVPPTRCAAEKTSRVKIACRHRSFAHTSGMMLQATTSAWSSPPQVAPAAPSISAAANRGGWGTSRQASKKPSGKETGANASSVAPLVWKWTTLFP